MNVQICNIYFFQDNFEQSFLNELKVMSHFKQMQHEMSFNTIQYLFKSTNNVF